MRYRIWMLGLVSALAASAATPVVRHTAEWARDGREFYLNCEFKQAARAFEHAAAEEPDRAAFHYWLGKSYARLADVSSPFTAAGYARKAAHSLEEALRQEPSNEEYARELFDLYVDSPEWFSGGMERARALLERYPATDADAIAASRAGHTGGGWWIRLGILRTSAAIGRVASLR